MGICWFMCFVGWFVLFVCYFVICFNCDLDFFDFVALMLRWWVCFGLVSCFWLACGVALMLRWCFGAVCVCIVLPCWLF